MLVWIKEVLFIIQGTKVDIIEFVPACDSDDDDILDRHHNNKYAIFELGKGKHARNY